MVPTAVHGRIRSHGRHRTAAEGSARGALHRAVRHAVLGFACPAVGGPAAAGHRRRALGGRLRRRLRPRAAGAGLLVHSGPADPAGAGRRHDLHHRPAGVLRPVRRPRGGLPALHGGHRAVRRRRSRQSAARGLPARRRHPAGGRRELRHPLAAARRACRGGSARLGLAAARRGRPEPSAGLRGRLRLPAAAAGRRGPRRDPAAPSSPGPAIRTAGAPGSRRSLSSCTPWCVADRPARPLPEHSDPPTRTHH